MRFTSSLFLVLLLLVPAHAASKARRSHRNMAVRNHLAVPTATVCTDVDGDGTQDSILMDGDICVDSDDGTLCWWVGDSLYCASGTDMAGFLRSTPMLFDDFFQFNEIDTATAQAGSAPIDTPSFRWMWVPSGSPASASVSHTSASAEDAGHLGVMKIALGDNDDGGIRSPKSGEERTFQLVPNHFARVTLHIVMKITTSSGDPADMQLDFGFCKTLGGGDCSGDDSIIFELMSNTGAFSGRAYGHIRCETNPGSVTKREFSPSWPVDQDWHRWTIIYDKGDSEVRFYRDGTQVGSCASGEFDPAEVYFIVPATAETSNSPPASQTFHLDYVELLVEPETGVRR